MLETKQAQLLSLRHVLACVAIRLTQSSKLLLGQTDMQAGPHIKPTTSAAVIQVAPLASLAKGCSQMVPLL